MSTAVRPATSAFASGMSSSRLSKDSNLYEGLCKYLLRQRTTHLLCISLAVTYILLATSTLDILGQGLFSIIHFLRPVTIFWTIIGFIFGVLPVLVLRKVSLTPKRIAKPTMAAQIRHTVTQLSSWRTLGVYSASSVALTVAFMYMAPENSRFSMFKSTTLYPWHLNERFVFLFSSNLALATAYSIYVLLWQRNAIEWPVTRDTRISEVITERIIQQLSFPPKFGLAVSSFFPIIYIILRRPIFRAALIVGKPFINNFLRSRVWAISVSLCLRSACLNVATVTVWFISELIFDVYTSHPAPLSSYVTSPTECLVSGITSKSSEGYYQCFALAELSEIAQSSTTAASNRRKTIFSDLKTPPNSSAWSLICRESLIVLGKDYQTLLKRGAATSAPLPSASIAPVSTTPVTPRTPSALKRGSIYATTQGTPADRLMESVSGYLAMADGAVDQTTRRISMPNVFTSTTSKSISQASTAIIPSSSSSASLGLQAYEGAKRVLPTPVAWFVEQTERYSSATGSALFTSSVERVVEMALPNMVVDMWAIDSLCHLAANSFTEDPYGLVQRDIPRILEAMLAFQQALETFKKEVNDPACDSLVDPLSTSLGQGLHVIIVTFRDRLSAFKFPPAVARRLQDVVENSS